MEAYGFELVFVEAHYPLLNYVDSNIWPPLFWQSKKLGSFYILQDLANLTLSAVFPGHRGKKLWQWSGSIHLKASWKLNKLF